MVDRHYDDEALISFLESAASAASDPHLAACGDCRETLETLQTLATTMQDEAVWQPPADSAPNPRTIATLRAFADQMDREDAAAEELLPALIAAPRESWAARTDQNPGYRTAGMVRRLLAAADRAIDTMPPDAVALTALATTIADRIEVSGYESDAVAKLRGAAWRDHAYALYYTGSFSEAEKAVLVSESHFSDCVVGEYDAARVGVVRALVDKAFGRSVAAARHALNASGTFTTFADVDRLASSRTMEAHLAVQVGDYRRALSIFKSVERDLADSEASDVQARTHANLAFVCRELGDLTAALDHLRSAAEIYEMLGVATEAARVRWNVAKVLATAGKHVDAVPRLHGVATEFRALGMESEATLASLDAAEILLQNGDYASVEAICAQAMSSFGAAGLTQTPNVLTALAYLQESAANRKVTPELLRHVGVFVRRLERQPQLMFAPPAI